jgi:hypothetical protein
MRFGFGLVGILVTMAVIMMMMKYSYLSPAVMSAQHSARDQSQQISGHDANGQDARQSATLVDNIKNNKLASFKVTAVTTGGGYETYFGLQVNDDILGVIDQGTEFDVNDPIIPADRDKVLEVYEKSGQLKVDRPGVGVIILPLPGNGGGNGAIGLPGGVSIPNGAGSSRAPSGAIPTH